MIYKYIPPTPKDWVHLGSDREIQEESLKENRPKVNNHIMSFLSHLNSVDITKNKFLMFQEYMKVTLLSIAFVL